MFVQISVDYSSLPDPRTLKPHEVRFYYNGIRASLKKQTAPRG